MLTMLTQTHRAVVDGSINRVYRACGAAGGQLAVGADPGLNTLVTLLRPSRHRCRSRADPAPLRRHAHWDLRVAAEFGSRRACARPRGRGCPVPAPGDCSALEDSWFMFLGEGAFLAVIRHWQSSFVRHQALDAMQCGAIHENQSSAGKRGILNSRAELGNMSLDI
jgi:hypothetical protein